MFFLPFINEEHSWNQTWFSCISARQVPIALENVYALNHNVLSLLLHKYKVIFTGICKSMALYCHRFTVNTWLAVFINIRLSGLRAINGRCHKIKWPRIGVLKLLDGWLRMGLLPP